jgi:hypothetical protein
MTGFRHALAKYTPKWLSNRPGLQNAWKTLWAIALVCDGLYAIVLQGLYAAFPNLGTTTALPLIGQSRGIVQGPFESNLSFAARIAAWRSMWWSLGSDEVLCQQVQAYTQSSSAKPTVRVVTRGWNGSGPNWHWTSLSPSGVFTYVTGVPLPWDTNSNPTWSEGPSPFFSDLWIIIDGFTWAAETRSLATLSAAYGSLAAWAASNTSIGLLMAPDYGRALAGIVAQCVPPHANVRSLIITMTPGDYDPTNPSSIPPNGYCEAWAYQVTGTTAVPQRPSGDRYMQFSFSRPQNGA